MRRWHETASRLRSFDAAPARKLVVYEVRARVQCPTALTLDKCRPFVGLTGVYMYTCHCTVMHFCTRGKTSVHIHCRTCCVRARTLARSHARTHPRTHTHTHTHTHAHTRTHARAQTNTYAEARIHTPGRQKARSQCHGRYSGCPRRRRFERQHPELLCATLAAIEFPLVQTFLFLGWGLKKALVRWDASNLNRCLWLLRQTGLLSSTSSSFLNQLLGSKGGT